MTQASDAQSPDAQNPDQPERRTAKAAQGHLTRGEPRLWARVRFGGNMRQLSIAAGILLTLTAVAAIAHGYFGNRWLQRSGLSEVGQVVSGMPPQDLPNWRYRDEVAISDGVIEMLKTTGYVSRTFTYQPSGTAPSDNPLPLTVAVFVGSPGRITAHDPQVCYSAVDFSGIGSRRHIEFEDVEGVRHQFWTMAVSRSDDPNHSLIVSHAWGTDGACSAAEYPRLAYLGQPYLYKIQLAMPAGGQSDLESNRSIEFLKEFLPQLRRTIQQAKSSE